MIHNRARATEAVRGLPMFKAADPEALSLEREELAELETKPIGARWPGYFKKTGPGWLQIGKAR